MFYYDLLKKELFDYINSEYSKKNIKDVPKKSSFNLEIPTNKNLAMCLQILQWYLPRK